MLNCWSEYADKRPTFPDLVREFDRMITMLSDKVNVIIIVRRRILPLKFSRNFNSSCQAVTLLRLLQRQHLYIIPTLVTLSHKICSVFYINNSLRLARKYAWIFVPTVPPNVCRFCLMFKYFCHNVCSLKFIFC